MFGNRTADDCYIERRSPTQGYLSLLLCFIFVTSATANSEINNIFYENNVNFNFQTLSIHRHDSWINCAASCSSIESCSRVKFRREKCELLGRIESYLFRPQTVFLKKTNFTDCPVSFVPFDDSCILYIPRSVKWTKASQACAGIGAHRIILRTENDRMLIKTYLTEKDSPHSVWSGANDRDTEGVWFWDNGEAVDMVEAAWDIYQPNNAKEDEDCAISYASRNYAMNDQSCSKTKPFICQID